MKPYSVFSVAPMVNSAMTTWLVSSKILQTKLLVLTVPAVLLRSCALSRSWGWSKPENGVSAL